VNSPTSEMQRDTLPFRTTCEIPIANYTFRHMRLGNIDKFVEKTNRIMSACGPSTSPALQPSTAAEHSSAGMARPQTVRNSLSNRAATARQPHAEEKVRGRVCKRF